MFPEIVLGRGKSNVDERPPFWTLRFANQTHVRFSRDPVAFACVAADARANHVFPRGRSSSVAWDDMIQIEFAPVKALAAVLAGVLVALEHIVSGKFHFLLRKPIENKKHNHSGNTNLK